VFNIHVFQLIVRGRRGAGWMSCPLPKTLKSAHYRRIVPDRRAASLLVSEQEEELVSPPLPLAPSGVRKVSLEAKFRLLVPKREPKTVDEQLVGP
jgi:hypothetical protein